MLTASHLTAAAAEPPATEAPVPERSGPSRGLRLGDSLTLGGYATLQLAAPGSAVDAAPPADRGDADGRGDAPHANSQSAQRNRLSLSHLSAMLWWEPAARWKVFGELDVQDALQWPRHDDNDDGRASASNVALERLYVDYLAGSEVNFRVGKFLTPIGRWNQEHSDPLTWTTLRPLLSQSAFPTNATGLMVYGSLPAGPQGVDYQLFASQGSDLHASPRIDPFDRAVGLRIATELSASLQVGLSAAQFNQRLFGRDRFRLLGLDAVWAVGGAELSAEAIVRRSQDVRVGEERGWFVQGRWPLAQRWSAVTRLEAYKESYDASSIRSALLGVVYRSGQHWVGKLEWVQPSARSFDQPRGLLGSLTLQY